MSKNMFIVINMYKKHRYNKISMESNLLQKYIIMHTHSKFVFSHKKSNSVEFLLSNFGYLYFIP